jgi:hypothetical protein
LIGLFSSKKLNPERMRVDLRKEISGLDEVYHGLNYDIKRLSKERDMVIRKGMDAHRNGNTDLKREMAQELRSLNAEIDYVRQNSGDISKSRLLCRITLRRIESALPGGAMEVAGRVLGILHDPELNDMLMNKECTEDSFRQTLDRKMETMMQGIHVRSSMVDSEVGQEEDLFGRLVEAEESGDERKVRTLMSKATGEGKVEDDIDTLLPER